MSKILQNVDENIKKYGLANIHVFASEESPAFSYTVGFTNQDLPEFITFGILPETGQDIFNDLYKRIGEGELFELGVPNNTVIKDLPVYFFAVSQTQAKEYINAANQYFDRNLEAIQMVWPDNKGNFPWDKDYNEGYRQIVIADIPKH